MPYTSGHYNVLILERGGVKVHIGKLYRFSDEQFVADINYQLLGETLTNFWGELIPTEYVRIGDGGDYTRIR